MVKYFIRNKKKKFFKKSKNTTKKNNQRKKFKNSYILIGCSKNYSLPNLNKKEKQNQENDIEKEKNDAILIINKKDKKEDRAIQKEKIEIKKSQNNIKVLKIDNNDSDIPKMNNILIKEINKKKLGLKNYKPKGLENFNYNCYMNSLLQCLFYLKEFRNYFLTNNFEKNQLVCLAMKDVMNGLNINDGKNFFSPRKMKNEIKKNEIFKDGEGSDVTDLLDYIFAGINSEIEQDSSSNHTVEYQTQIQDKRQVYKETYKEINFDIIINKLFVGFYEKEFKCKSGHLKYSFQSEYRIVFSLEELFSYYKDKKVLTLYDCFDHYNRTQKIEEIEDNKEEDDVSNSSDIFNKKSNEEDSEEKSDLNPNDEDGSKNIDKCQNCEQKYIFVEKVFRTPKYLIIILDRGYKKKCDKTVIFDEIIDLSNYMDDEKYEYQEKYKLTGVCVHHGRSGNCGHYTSICLCDDDKYYHLNDSHSSILKNNDEFYEGSPYILFYSRLELTSKQKLIKSYFYQLKRKIVSIIKTIESMKCYSIIEINDFHILKYIFTETKSKENNTTTIEIDFSEFNHKSKNPKLTIKKTLIANKRDKEEKENIYWDDNLSNEENEENFEKTIRSYFKEFEIKNKSNKSINCCSF